MNWEFGIIVNGIVLRKITMSARHNPPRSRWVADFETTTDPGDCRVWAWGLTNVDEDATDVEFGICMESFVARMGQMAAQVYFHNLGFDGIFILFWLMTNGYRHYAGDGRLMKGEFQTLISDSNKFYSITVCWKDTGKRTEFRDSLKKLPMSVARIAKSFQLNECKLEIDYHEYRAPGHKLTVEEMEYLSADVVIVARALRQQLSEGMTKLTVGADSLYQFKQIMGHKDFERAFPVLSQEMDAEIRRAYRGGWVYADKRYRGKIVERPGKVFDVNSLYPSVMYDRVLPYGTPVYVDGPPEPMVGYPLYITAITFTAKLKEACLPCIQIKGTNVFAPNVYQEVIDEPVTMCCTNVDLALWHENYDLTILAFEGTWYFRGAIGFFKDYIDYWMNIKMTATGGLREIAKLHLNSLYGKFATNPNITGKIPSIENNCVALHTGHLEMRDPVYTPMGVFITAYARDVTIRAAQANYDTFAYADTDSLHLFTDTMPELNIDPVKLGAWKHEQDFVKAIYVRPKVYSEYGWEIKNEERVGDPGCLPYPVTKWAGMPKMTTHIAGLPYEVQQHVGFDDYFNGHVFHGKLTPKRVPGGVVLIDTEWKLSDDTLAIVTERDIE